MEDVQKKLDFIESYKKAKNAASGSAVDSNANVTVKNVATMFAEVPKADMIELNRTIVRKYLKEIDPEMVAHFDEDLKRHIIYSHDESSIYPYCVAVSLYPYLLEGLKPLGGTSGAPKHADSFIGGLTNLIFLIAGQFAGAVAVPETLPYLDHFLRIDYGDDYIKHLDETIEAFGNRKYTLGKKVEDLFQQFVYCVNQPAAARGYQSPFVNISYFDKGYFNSIFSDFVFPDGDEPNYESTMALQKMFMKWFNKERLKEVITFPVETMNLLYDKETKEFVDKDMADFTAEMWSEGHSFFLYNSDSADALSSCCFSKDTKVLSKSSNGVNWMTFEELYKADSKTYKKNFTIFHNGSWVKGKTIKLPNRPMYKVTTSNKKEIIVSDNHLNVTLRGDVPTCELTTDDYLMFNTRQLDSFKEKDQRLTYEQGFAVGAFIGDGSFSYKKSTDCFYEIDYSLNESKYDRCVKMVNEANKQLGGEFECRLSTPYNNVYPMHIKSTELADFIAYWTNWERGTYCFNKELNMDCLLQSYDFRKGILDGWYHTDGGNSNRCYTTSAKLAESMELLITSLGMCSVIDVTDRTDEAVVIRESTYKRNYPLYCIRWYDMKNKRSSGNVYKVVNNSVYFKVSSIEPVEYDDDIYCFEMADQTEPYFTLPNGIITHNCRLKNGIENNTFSYTLGAGGLRTGSKKVITMNLNRITQDWDRAGRKEPLEDYIGVIVKRVHKYLIAWNMWLKDLYEAGLLSVYTAGYISLEDQYLTVGTNAGLEAAEYLGIEPRADNKEYQDFMGKILTRIKNINIEDRTSEVKFNTEFVPAENAAAKFYNWDKRDGYWVPETRNLYNSYFYPVEDTTYDVLEKMRLHGAKFIGHLDGGSALHANLDSHLSKEQYRMLMKYAAQEGCSYFTFNIPNTICNDCGNIDKRYLHECPKCSSANVDWATRVIGYLKRVSNFSLPRQIEAEKRYYIPNAESRKDNKC